MKKIVFLMTAMALVSIATGMFSCKDDKPEVEKIYTVTFDADGGSPVPAAQEVKEGEKATAPTTNPSKQGYVFLFWRLKGIETAYNFQTAVTGNITLQAKWEAEAKVEYWQVTWNLNGGAWPANDNHATQAVKGGTLAEPNEPVKAGRVFEGWYKEEALTNKVSFPYDVKSVKANITLYAKWEDIDPKTDYFGTWRSSVDAWIQITINTNKIVFFNKEGLGYTIEGLTWSATNNPGGAYLADYPVGYRVTGTLTAFNGYYMPKANGSGYCAVGDIALNSFYISADKQSIRIGNWETAEQEARYVPCIKKFDVEYWQVTWNLNDGAWPTNDNHATQVAKDGKLAAPAKPVKSSYDFGGWYKEASLTNQVNFPYDMSAITDNFTIYAKWEAESSGELSVSPNTPISFTKTGGASETKTITVTTNQPSWDAVSDQTWCTIVKSDNQFTVTASVNDAGERKATITVSAGNAKNVTIEVTQAPNAELKITCSNTLWFGYWGDGMLFGVTTDQPSLNVTSDMTWCTLELLFENEKYHEYRITIKPNETVTPRKATITVTAGIAIPQIVTIFQSGFGAQLSLSSSSIVFSKSGGSTKPIIVTTNQPSWDAVSNQDWLTVSKDGNTFTVTAPPFTGVSRSAVVTVTAGYAMPVVFYITQKNLSTDLLEKALYQLGYAEKIAKMHREGLRPTIIYENGYQIAVFYGGTNSIINYIWTQKYGNVYFHTDYGQRPSVMAESNVRSSLTNGTYDYANDPQRVVAYMIAYSAGAPTLDNLKLISNNDAITQELYNRIFIRNDNTYLYKMIVYGKNSEGILIGKYVGWVELFVNSLMIYHYHCIDSEDPSFGMPSTKEVPNYP